MTLLAIKLNVVPEPESDIELPETQSKRKASEMDFEIPPAKRTEPAEGSTTESESDLDVIPPSSTLASALVSTPSKGTRGPLSCQSMLTLARPRRSQILSNRRLGHRIGIRRRTPWRNGSYLSCS